MPNDLYIYTTPAAATVTVKLDLESAERVAQPGTFNGREDAHLIQLPAETARQGTQLSVEHEGYIPVSHRGILQPSETEEARFLLDDVHLVVVPEPPVPPEPPIPPQPPSNDPEAIINSVYATGLYNLATKSGCGTFTEACCTELHLRNNQMWGHVAKTAGQNQWNGHAVDAVQCLAGGEHGIWDIIVSSVSSSAHPAYNRAGDAKPELWYYPANAVGGYLLVPKTELEFRRKRPHR